jgi:hypothetical protein
MLARLLWVAVALCVLGALPDAPPTGVPRPAGRVAPATVASPAAAPAAR